MGRCCTPAWSLSPNSTPWQTLFTVVSWQSRISLLPRCKIEKMIDDCRSSYPSYLTDEDYAPQSAWLRSSRDRLQICDRNLRILLWCPYLLQWVKINSKGEGHEDAFCFEAMDYGVCMLLENPWTWSMKPLRVVHIYGSSHLSCCISLTYSSVYFPSASQMLGIVTSTSRWYLWYPSYRVLPYQTRSVFYRISEPSKNLCHRYGLSMMHKQVTFSTSSVDWLSSLMPRWTLP